MIEANSHISRFLFWEKTENKEFSCNALQISCKTHIIIVPVNRKEMIIWLITLRILA